MKPTLFTPIVSQLLFIDQPGFNQLLAVAITRRAIFKYGEFAIHQANIPGIDGSPNIIFNQNIWTVILNYFQRIIKDQSSIGFKTRMNISYGINIARHDLSATAKLIGLNTIVGIGIPLLMKLSGKGQLNKGYVAFRDNQLPFALAGGPGIETLPGIINRAPLEP